MLKDFIYSGFKFKIKNNIAIMYKEKQLIEYIKIPAEFQNENISYYLKIFTERHYPRFVLNTTKIKSQS